MKGKLKKMKPWTDFELKLIKEVREHPVLYENCKFHSFKYKRPLKSDGWLEIGKRLNLPPKECKNRWKNIRDVYIKKQRMVSTGFIKNSKHKFLDGTLSFLDEAIGINNNQDILNQTSSSSSADNNKKEQTKDLFLRIEPMACTCSTPPSNIENRSVVTQDMLEKLLEQKNENSVEVADPKLMSMISFKSLEETIDKFTEPGPYNMITTNKVPRFINTLEKGCSIRISDVWSHKVVTPPARQMEMINKDCIEEDDEDNQTQIDNNVNDDSVNKKSLEIERANINKCSRTLKKIDEELSNAMDNVDEGSASEPATSNGFVKPSVESGENSKDDKINSQFFFNDVGDYVSNFFPVKKQMEIRLKIMTLITQAELEMLQDEGEMLGD